MRRIFAGLMGLGIVLTALVSLAAPASAATPAAVTPMAGTVIGIEFWDANFQGATYTITGGTCSASLDNVDFSLATIASSWNDEISSFRSYANCWTKIWENSNFNGASYGYTGDSANVGSAMNDRTSSIQWS